MDIAFENVKLTISNSKSSLLSYSFVKTIRLLVDKFNSKNEASVSEDFKGIKITVVKSLNNFSNVDGFVS